MDKDLNPSLLSAIDPAFAKLALRGKASKLQTEVEILKSPYVLMNVFESFKTKVWSNSGKMDRQQGGLIFEMNPIKRLDWNTKKGRIEENSILQFNPLFF